MSFLSLVTRFLPSGLYTILLAGIMSLSLGGYAAWEIRGWKDSGLLLQSQQHLSEVQHEFDTYQVKSIADTAQANQETVSKMEMAQTKINSLTNDLEATKLKVQQKSQQLLKVLNNAPLSDQNSLSATVLNYLSLLRIQQAGNPNASHN
jgi:hypothetical protein